MYPDSFLWWLGGTAIILGIIGVIAIFVFMFEDWLQRRDERKSRDSDPEVDNGLDR